MNGRNVFWPCNVAGEFVSLRKELLFTLADSENNL